MQSPRIQVFMMVVLAVMLIVLPFASALNPLPGNTGQVVTETPQESFIRFLGPPIPVPAYSVDPLPTGLGISLNLPALPAFGSSMNLFTPVLPPLVNPVQTMTIPYSGIPAVPDLSSLTRDSAGPLAGSYYEGSGTPAPTPDIPLPDFDGGCSTCGLK
jgi:hypothetical protein